MPSNLRHDHPRICTLTGWHSYTNLARTPWTYTGCANMRTSYVKPFESYRLTDVQTDKLCVVTSGHVTKMVVTSFDPRQSKTPCYMQSDGLICYKSGVIAQLNFTLRE